MHSIVLGDAGPKVLRRAKADGLPGSLGGFGLLGRVVVRWPLLVIAFWIALAVALFLLLPPLAKIAEEKQPEFLPSDAPVLVANNAMINLWQAANLQRIPGSRRAPLRASRYQPGMPANPRRFVTVLSESGVSRVRPASGSGRHTGRAYRSENLRRIVGGWSILRCRAAAFSDSAVSGAK
jgi:hypothetical protein